MSKLDEHLSEQFHRWEVRGRGWQVFKHPVALEPPFIPFPGYSRPRQRPQDDGRKHSALSGFLARVQQQIAPIETGPPRPAPEPEVDEREPG